MNKFTICSIFPWDEKYRLILDDIKDNDDGVLILLPLPEIIDAMIVIYTSYFGILALDPYIRK